MARYDARNTGQREDGPSGCLETQWSYRIQENGDEEAITDGPVVVDGRIYLPTTKGLRVFDTQTGEIRWRGEYLMNVSPVVIGETCWFATENPAAGTSAVNALNLTAHRKRWSRPMPNPVGTDLTVTNETVFVGGEGGILCALNAKTGEVRWEFESTSTT